MNKTFSQKPADVTREWVVLDASEAPLGRVAGAAAKRLIGKHKPTYTAHVDGGDYVIIVNAEKAILTGAKADSKTYYRHSGFPGGIKAEGFNEAMLKDPSKVFVAAIRGMLPKNKLMDDRLKRLKVYAGAEHNHDAQKPVKIGVK